MRIIKKSYTQTLEHYRLISEFEKENHLTADIGEGLSSIFLLSQNFPLKDVADFFSGENFSLTESFEELEASYELIKFGFYKQAMISLRVGLDIGLFSIYWSIIGKESEDFKKWVSSKKDTPYKNQNFWKVFKSNNSIKEFDNKYGLIQDIKDLGFSDFVHTKGIWYSNFGEFQRMLRGQDTFENFSKWVKNFKQIVKILEILHLLKFPTLNLRYSTDFLISKFGTHNRIPQFGAGYGDEMNCVYSFIPEDQEQFIKELAQKNKEVVRLINWLNELPDLTEKEIRHFIIEDQKQNIELSGGFENWRKSIDANDKRIDLKMLSELKDWAENNNLMNIESMIKNRKSR